MHELGFRSKLSTVIAIFEVTEEIRNLKDQKNREVMLVLLNLKKAFDRVNQLILLDKLEQYGARGKSLVLLKIYLANRKQFCNFERTLTQFSRCTVWSTSGFR